jgi:dienelactone hydrolase
LRITPFILSALFMAVACAQSPDPLLWDSLTPGAYAIGYRSYFELDRARRFGPENGPRPILINIWYPAEATDSAAVQYREYLEMPALARYPSFHSLMEPFLLDVVTDDIFEKKAADLNANERAFLETVRDAPTIAHRDAQPAGGRFPVILYHSGASGSYEDNSVICEFLASHGYVVMTSAFPYSDGVHMNNSRGSPKTSWADLAFLLAYARTLGFADTSRAGAFGHSMGAQYLLEWIGQPLTDMKALVSLDTTLEYTPEDLPGHLALRKRIAKLQPPRIPVLIAASADRNPRFSTWDRYLPHRFEASIRHFNHNDFVLHGSLARAFNHQKTEQVRRNYDRMARAICAFFDANLKQASSDWDRLLLTSNDEFRLGEHIPAKKPAGSS